MVGSRRGDVECVRGGAGQRRGARRAEGVAGACLVDGEIVECCDASRWGLWGRSAERAAAGVGADDESDVPGVGGDEIAEYVFDPDGDGGGGGPRRGAWGRG